MADESLTPLRYQLADPADNSKLTELRQQYRDNPAIQPLIKTVNETTCRSGRSPPAGIKLAHLRPAWEIRLLLHFQTKTRPWVRTSPIELTFPVRPRTKPSPTSLPLDQYQNPVKPTTQPTSTFRRTRRIIDRPHLSTVFKSTQTNTWKVAFSAPIVADNQIIGAVVVTAELGDFVVFKAKDSRYWMLVDGRKGVVLGHPIYSDLKTRQLCQYLKHYPKSKSTSTKQNAAARHDRLNHLKIQLGDWIAVLILKSIPTTLKRASSRLEAFRCNPQSLCW